jgi:DNA (cytosine-5)-methyltransferase 1
MELNVLDLFSGIGGFSVGLEATGKFKTIGFCEQDKFCQKVLRKHWSDVPIYEDIKKLDARKIKADVVVGGFPCQSISIAGKQKGKDDDRYLFPEMLRVIKEVQPRWIIGENVQNLINISDGQILQDIHNSLEAENYEVQTFNITASSQGAWHKRSRVWIVAANTNPRLSIGENEKIFTRGNTFDNGSSADVPNTNSKGSQGHRLQSNNLQKSNQSKINTDSNFTEQQTWWQTQSSLCGVPDGIQYGLDKDRSHRIKALGNSIVPQIVTEIGKAIIKAEEENV